MNVSDSVKSKVAGPCLWVLLASVAVTAYGLDQFAKWLIVSTMSPGEKIAVLPPVLQWYYITNAGAAFSLGENFTLVYTVVMAAAVCTIVFFARLVRSAAWALALGLVLGGAAGNLTDRLFRPPGFGFGRVVDFISVPQFAIFNLADCAIVTGMALVCLLTLRGVPFSQVPSATGQAKPSRWSHGE